MNTGVGAGRSQVKEVGGAYAQPASCQEMAPAFHGTCFREQCFETDSHSIASADTYTWQSSCLSLLGAEIIVLTTS